MINNNASNQLLLGFITKVSQQFNLLLCVCVCGKKHINVAK